MDYKVYQYTLAFARVEEDLYHSFSSRRQFQRDSWSSIVATNSLEELVKIETNQIHLVKMNDGEEGGAFEGDFDQDEVLAMMGEKELAQLMKETLVDADFYNGSVCFLIF